MDNNKGPIDLGSTPAEEFDPFATIYDLTDDNVEETAADISTQPPDTQKTQAPSSTQSQTTAIPSSITGNVYDGNIAFSENPLESAIDAAETKDAEKDRQGLTEKPPVFDYAGATEDIEDPSITFDELRIAKAADFPEFEDGKSVGWTVEYGKITKTVSNAKSMSISKMKSGIEASKEFLDALKKTKDKNPICKIKPRVNAKPKGTVSAPGYKGVFANMDEVNSEGKVISILPAFDGKVYEIRNTPLGRFSTPVIGCNLLSDVKAGYIPVFGIPKIPGDLIMQIISFFRYHTVNGAVNEALVNVYWDTESKVFVVDAPEQFVSKFSVHSNYTPDYLDERYIHFMDIHSHNNMRAFFSSIDDESEKETRLYTVIGCLDKYFPEIITRISNGGKFHEINPSEVFDYISCPFPDEWHDKVSFREPHKDVASKGAACETELFSTYIIDDDAPRYVGKDMTCCCGGGFV